KSGWMFIGCWRGSYFKRESNEKSSTQPRTAFLFHFPVPALEFSQRKLFKHAFFYRNLQQFFQMPINLAVIPFPFTTEQTKMAGNAVDYSQLTVRNQLLFGFTITRREKHIGINRHDI